MPLTFDGVDDRISTANRNNGPTAFPFAVAAVIKLSSVAGFQVVLQYSFGAFDTTGFMLTAIDNNGLGMRWWIGTGVAADATTTVLPNNTWLFVAASSLNSTTHRLYSYNYETRAVISNISTTTSSPFVNPSASFFHIGMDTGADVSYGDNFSGIMSYVGVYKTDFTGHSGDAFQAMAFLGPYAVATPSNLWTFNEMTSTITREQIAGGNDGTLTNFPASPWVEGGLPSPVWSIGGRRRVSRPAIVSAGGAVTTRKPLMGVGI